jgi:hypothetical protein
VSLAYSPPLRVAGFHATRLSDPERGPQVRLRQSEATPRLMVDGELVWVFGPRRKEIATLVVDEAVPRGEVIVRDLAGVAPSEIIRLGKIDTDSSPLQRYV